MQQVLDNTNNIISLPYISITKREQFSDLFILNPISLKITPLMNILKIDYIIKTKIIENTENRNMNSKVNGKLANIVVLALFSQRFLSRPGHWY